MGIRWKKFLAKFPSHVFIFGTDSPLFPQGCEVIFVSDRYVVFTNGKSPVTLLLCANTCSPNRWSARWASHSVRFALAPTIQVDGFLRQEHWEFYPQPQEYKDKVPSSTSQDPIMGATGTFGIHLRDDQTLPYNHHLKWSLENQR